MRSCRRLKIARLFTLSTPHRGALLANLPSLHPLHVNMRMGSSWIRKLNDGLDHPHDDPGYSLYCYTRLNDRIVGERNTAPPGKIPWWLPKGWFDLAHFAATRDPRIQADIARRLRGEQPFSTTPPAPFPR